MDAHLLSLIFFQIAPSTPIHRAQVPSIYISFLFMLKMICNQFMVTQSMTEIKEVYQVNEYYTHGNIQCFYSKPSEAQNHVRRFRMKLSLDYAQTLAQGRFLGDFRLNDTHQRAGLGLVGHYLFSRRFCWVNPISDNDDSILSAPSQSGYHNIFTIIVAFNSSFFFPRNLFLERGLDERPLMPDVAQIE